MTRRTLPSLLLAAFFTALLFADTQLAAGPLVFYPPELVLLLATGLIVFSSNERRAVWQSFLAYPAWLRWTLGSFLLSGIIGTIVSPLFPQSIGAFKTWIISPLAAFVLLMAYFRQPEPRRLVTWALVGFGLVTVALALPQLLTDGGRLTGHFDSANYVAIIIGPIAALSLWQAVTTKRWPYVASAILLLAALALTRSIGGLFGFAAAATVGWYFLPKGWKVGLALAVVAIAAVATPLVSSRLSGDGNSLRARKEMWSTATYMVRLWPLTGAGLRGYEHHYSNLVGTVVGTPQEWDSAQPHNLFLAIWLGLGLVGLLAVVYLVAQLLSFSVPIAAQLSLVAILAHGLIDTPFFRLDFVVLFWVYAYLILAAKEPNA